MSNDPQYPLKKALYKDLENQKENIQKLVAFHCGLESPDQVKVLDIVDESTDGLIWLYGSPNLCIPVETFPDGESLPTKMVFKVPLPHRLDGEEFGDSIDERVRSEAATYIWVDKNCPDVPIPGLRGFGVPDGLSVSARIYVNYFCGLTLTATVVFRL